MELLQPAAQGRGRRQLIPQNGGQALVLPQDPHVIHALAAQSRMDDHRFYHLRPGQAFGILLRRQAPFGHAWRSTPPHHLHQNGHPGVGGHLLRQTTGELQLHTARR